VTKVRCEPRLDWCPPIDDKILNGIIEVPSRRFHTVGYVNCNPGYYANRGNFIVCNKETKKWMWAGITVDEWLDSYVYGGTGDL
jgi:hypothetical protein